MVPFATTVFGLCRYLLLIPAETEHIAMYCSVFGHLAYKSYKLAYKYWYVFALWLPLQLWDVTPLSLKVCEPCICTAIYEFVAMLKRPMVW